jgi:hypothetical protein
VTNGRKAVFGYGPMLCRLVFRRTQYAAYFQVPLAGRAILGGDLLHVYFHVHLHVLGDVGICCGGSVEDFEEAWCCVSWMWGSLNV